MTAKIQVRRDTTTNWNAGTPPTLDVGEIGLDTTLKQIKIGDGSSNWTALPWLGGTLPYFSSPNANIDDSSLRVPGVYRWAGIASITSGTVPAAPIDIKAADGGINMLVLAFGAVVLQHLWTDGDGTQPQKSFTRIYDTAYRAWTPQNIWGVSATEGVDVVAKSITLKDTATGLTVDGNSTLTGNVTVNGTTTLGNANADIVTVQAGTVSAPIITTTGDTNTGIYFPAADKVALAAGGADQLVVDNGAADVLAAIFRKGATLNERLDMNNFRIIDVANPTQLTDALNWQTLLSHLAFIEATNLDNGTTLTAPGGSTWAISGINGGGGTATATPNGAYAGSRWDGVIIGYNVGTGNVGNSWCRTFSNSTAPSVGAVDCTAIIMVAVRRS
jgi:hypothetical protein